MAKYLRDILIEGWFRDQKTKIGHSLPSVARKVIAATVATGKAKSYELDGHTDKANNLRKWRNRLLTDPKKQVPKFKDNK